MTTTEKSTSNSLDAARRALAAYPGAVGELVHREIGAHLESALRADDPLMPRLIAQLLGPDGPAAPDTAAGPGNGAPAHPGRDAEAARVAAARTRAIRAAAATQAEYLAGRRPRPTH